MNYIEIKVVLTEANSIVYRDILLSSENNMLQLHQAIIDAFEFEGKQMASFIVEGDSWQAAAEYPLESLGENDNELMKDVTVEQVLKEEGNQLTYIYDYLNEWRFHIEVMAINNKSEIIETPKLLKSFGRAPIENERELSGKDAESILMDAILGDEFSEEEENEDDFFNSGDYDSIDDYEEFQ